MSDSPTKSVAPGDVIKENVQKWLAHIAEEAPGVFANILWITKRWAEKMFGGPGEMPKDDGSDRPVDFTDDDGTGTGYTLTTCPITDEQIRHIEQGIAEGIVSAKAAQWVSGFITGFMARGI